MRELFRHFARWAVQPVLHLVDRVSGADRAATQSNRIHWAPSTAEPPVEDWIPGRPLPGHCRHGLRLFLPCPKCGRPAGGAR